MADKGEAVCAIYTFRLKFGLNDICIQIHPEGLKRSGWPASMGMETA